MSVSSSTAGADPSSILDSKCLPTDGDGQAGGYCNNNENGHVTAKRSNTDTSKSPLKPLGQVFASSEEEEEEIIMPSPLELSSVSSSGFGGESGRGSVSETSTTGKENLVPNKAVSIYEKWGSFESEPGIRYSSLCPGKGALVATPLNEPKVKTTWDVFQRGLSISPHGKCLGWRVGDAFQWWTYSEVAERVRGLCAALKAETHLSRQNSVGIYAPCIPQWLVCSLAINARSLCTVPLYDTLGPESCAYIINQVEMKVIFVDSEIAVGRILDSAKESTSLKKIVCFQQELSFGLLEKAKANSISLLTLNEFIKGVNVEEGVDVYDPPKCEDIAMIQYTSGTTGLPKGVVQTHRAYIANLSGVDYPFSAKLDPAITISSSDVCLQYLPLAHAYAQLMSTWLFYHGAASGFFGGNVTKLFEDATILKPTIMPMVPRLMNRLYGKVKAEVGENGLKAKFFWYCYDRKKDLVNRGIITRDSVWDSLAFRRIQRLLGGNVRFMSVGSAPISSEVLEFWRVCFGALIIEGYGQTECTTAATIAIGPSGGNVGHPLPCNLIKLADAEECGYFVKDGKGEVCIKGPNVMSGYYKQPEKTAETIDAGGWLHTGDIGEFLPDGSLRIFDRKKHIFKLAQGEYIAPEKIENVYAMCPLIAQVFVDGSSLESFTVAVVVPDPNSAEDWAKAKNVNRDTVMTNPDFVKHVFSEMMKVGKANKLNSLEQVKNIHLTSQAFTPANGLLTPSLKNKRPELRRFFEGEIAAMYKAGPAMVEPSTSSKCACGNGK